MNALVTLFGGFKENKTFRHQMTAEGISIWKEGAFSSSDELLDIKKSLDMGCYKTLRPLRGAFAIVSWDERQQLLTIACDHSGIKPIYYYHKKNVFFFSSQLKLLMNSDFFEKELNREALGLFLQYGYILAPHTIFKDCHKILPGHVLTYDVRNDEVKTNPYWDVLEFYNAPRLDVSEEEALEKAEFLLLDALGAEPQNYGAFLSGGYDSSLMVSLLKKKWGGSARTFAVAFEEEQYNEAPFARAVAEHLGTNHTEVLCSLEDAASLIRELPDLYDELFADSSAIPTTFVCRHMERSGIDVAFSGDGGDEVFGGYFKYVISQKLYNKWLKPLPLALRNGIASLLECIPPERIPWFSTHVYHFTQRYTRGRKLMRCNSPEKIMQSISQAFSSHEVRSLLGDYHEGKTFFDLNSEFSKDLDCINRMMAIDYKTYLPGDGNTKVERAALMSGLCVSSPILEPSVIEYAAQLPVKYKVREDQMKWLLKQLTHRYIPKEIMDRPKKGFAIPVAKWLRGPLKPLLLESLDEDTLKKQSVFNNVHGIIKIRDEFIRTGRVDFNQVWFFLMFQMWYERWMR